MDIIHRLTGEVLLQDSPSPFVTAYGPKLSPVLICGESMAKQSFKDECDINVIMARYEKTGVMPDFGGREGRFFDCTGSDFQRAMEIIANAKSMFAQLPAGVRARFYNDPGQMLDFVNDEANREEAQALGLLKPVEAPSAAPDAKGATPPAPPPAASAPAGS